MEVVRDGDYAGGEGFFSVVVGDKVTDGTWRGRRDMTHGAR